MEVKQISMTTFRKKCIPKDIAEVYGFLKSIRSECSDVFDCACRDLMHDLNADCQRWLAVESAPEPNWQAFRDEINSLCFDDGMPRLFE